MHRESYAVGFPVPALVPPRGSVPDLYACRCQVLQAVSLQTQLVILHSSDVFSCLVYLSRRAFKPAAVRDEGQACGTSVDFVFFPTEQRHEIMTFLFGAPVVL